MTSRDPVGVEIDLAAYNANIILSDGNKVTIPIYEFLKQFQSELGL